MSENRLEKFFKSIEFEHGKDYRPQTKEQRIRFRLLMVASIVESFREMGVSPNNIADCSADNRKESVRLLISRPIS